MRRKDQEITEISAIEAVIEKSSVCRLGMVDGDSPYVVPLCFGYRDRTIYVHGFPRGKKIDVLKKNPNVCVAFDINTGVVPAADACEWNMKYQSVIGLGLRVIRARHQQAHDSGIRIGPQADRPVLEHLDRVAG
ncbi:MAG: pyridoxamine 5'-phosphate oxidase family protein, partial [Desulfobacterales bacterium]|nr:pyridoxamine 5'-phosphate oxidase family protein [Desulfobacterales bacterium]